MGKSLFHRNISFELLSQLQLVLKTFFLTNPNFSSSKSNILCEKLDNAIFQKPKWANSFILFQKCPGWCRTDRLGLDTGSPTAYQLCVLYKMLSASVSSFVKYSLSCRRDMNIKWVSTCEMLTVGLVHSVFPISRSSWNEKVS